MQRAQVFQGTFRDTCSPAGPSRQVWDTGCGLELPQGTASLSSGWLLRENLWPRGVRSWTQKLALRRGKYPTLKAPSPRLSIGPNDPETQGGETRRGQSATPMQPNMFARFYKSLVTLFNIQESKVQQFYNVGKFNTYYINNIIYIRNH